METKRKNGFPTAPLIIFALLVFCDQFAKYMAQTYLAPARSADLLPGFIGLLYARNEGVAFGMFKGGRLVFIPLTVLVIAGIVVFFLKTPKERKFARLTLTLVCAGAFGNLIDRVANGYVVDFLCFEFIDFPIFNFADVFVVVGVILLAIIVVFDQRPPL